MPKAASWIQNFPELEFCKVCAKIIVCEKKFQIDQHLKTAMHKANLQKNKSVPVQQCVQTAFQNVKPKSEKIL